jgi:hypothetical protein
MSERSRVVLIVGAVAVAAAGGMIYLFKVHMPKKALAAAQKEITDWEQRVAEARTCLLGETPASGDSAEALSVRELMPDPWNRSTCTKLIGALSRGEGTDTGVTAVEEAWEAAERAAGKVATSFATHVDPFGEPRAERHKESPLPAALQELDQAHAKLRAAASMPPPPSTSIPKLAAADTVAVRTENQNLRWYDMTQLPSAGGAIAWGATDDRSEVEVVLPAGGAPTVHKVMAGVVRALPDPSWGVSVNNEPPATPDAAPTLAGLTLGAVGDSGGFTTMTGHGVKAPAAILAVSGKQTDGVVVFAAADKIGFGRATGGQPFAFPEKMLGSSVLATSAVDISGRSAVAWVDKDGAMTGSLIASGAEPVPLPLGAGDPSAASFKSCLTATHAWAGDDPQFVRFDTAAAQPHVLDGFELVACNDKHALLKRHASVEYAVCSDQCRMVKIPNLSYAAAVALVGDQVVAIRAHRGVVGVWRESGAPTFYRFPGTTFVGRFGHSDGKVIDFVGTLDDKATILRLPAR